jgi:hypothetical protein
MARRQGRAGKYCLSTCETIAIVELVRLAKLRWHVEQDYRELKGALGLITGDPGPGGTIMSP